MAAPIKAGLDVMKRLGLKAEAGMAVDISTVGEFSEVLISAHAPSIKDGQRLNIAATDAPFRRMSIDHLLAYVDAARRYPNVRQVNMHFAPRRAVEDTQIGGQEGDYRPAHRRRPGDSGLRPGARNRDRVGKQRQLMGWHSRGRSGGRGGLVEQERYLWNVAEEWSQVCEDVDRANVGLCLDSSHACTHAHRFPEEQREAKVLEFLAKPHLIRHAHWSDSYLHDTRGRTDSHLLVGKGSLPIELHRGIKYLDATLLLEHFRSAEELEEELEFIDSL